MFPSFTSVSPFLWSPGRCSWFGAKIKKVQVYTSKMATTLLWFETAQTSDTRHWRSPTSPQQCSPQTWNRGLGCLDSGWLSLKQEPLFCFHPSSFQETDRIVDVFHTHTRGSFHHKTPWRLHQDWPDLHYRNSGNNYFLLSTHCNAFSSKGHYLQVKFKC